MCFGVVNLYFLKNFLFVRGVECVMNEDEKKEKKNIIIRTMIEMKVRSGLESTFYGYGKVVDVN
jgi:hypothetical protein